jgi:hypothetical protein
MSGHNTAVVEGKKRGLGQKGSMALYWNIYGNIKKEIVGFEVRSYD